MNDSFAAKDAVADLSLTFESAEFVGKGRRWVSTSEDLAWTICIDQQPGRRTLSVTLKVDIRRPPIDHAVEVYFENRDRGRHERFQILCALDLDSTIAPKDRSAVLRDLGSAVAQFVGGLRSLSALKESYKRGELADAYVLRDARALFEA